MPDNSPAYRLIDVDPVTPLIGARVSGIRLTGELSAAVVAELQRALADHLVLFFENQAVSPAEQRAFGRLFGTLQVHQFLPSLEGFPEIVVLENDRERRPQVNFWHSDVTFAEQPPLGSILLAREVPDCGGDTIWASMYAAYEALSDRLRSLLNGLTALHVGQVDQYEAAYGRTASAARSGPPQAEHPVIRTHPVTGRKGIFVHAAATTKILGMSRAESDSLLQMLFRHTQTPEFQVRLHWKPNTVAFWDNRCTQHYALADYWPRRRLMHRVTIDGDRPK